MKTLSLFAIHKSPTKTQIWKKKDYSEGLLIMHEQQIIIIIIYRNSSYLMRVPLLLE